MKRFRLVINRLVNLLLTILVAVSIALALRHYYFQPFQVAGQSMEPTLTEGQMMVMAKNNQVDRFDLVIFPDPRGSGQSYVKRVIGLPGETVSAVDNTVYINGYPINEPYVHTVTEDFNLYQITGLEIIPEGYVFVLGDNRPYSADSRQFGLVDQTAIKGRVVFSLYPLDRFGAIR